MVEKPVSIESRSNRKGEKKTKSKAGLYFYETSPCLTIELARFCYYKIESIILHVIFGAIVAAHRRFLWLSHSENVQFDNAYAMKYTEIGRCDNPKQCQHNLLFIK